MSAPLPDRLVMARDGLDHLFEALRQRGFRIVGPTLRDGAIVNGELASAADLPAGWTDEQGPGSYRLRRRDDEALFGYVVGPQSPKRQLFPPSSVLWEGRRGGDGAATAGTVPGDGAEQPYAFIGLRSCEIQAIEVQDRVFLGGPVRDPVYEVRRRDAFMVAVNCGEAGGTCFCTSMGTGPRATMGFDLALTELLADGRHEFLVEIGSERGGEVMAEVPHRTAERSEAALADDIVERTAASMGRTMDTADIKQLLYANFEHPRWDDVAERCLSCSNCTMVCPTCFCFSVEDATTLDGESAARQRAWDSCFTVDHSYIHGGSVRGSNRSRYRQWMTHKLATWIDQFGTSGCVGCGRCITWCPVGIDITEEVAAIRATPGAVRGEEGRRAHA